MAHLAPATRRCELAALPLFPWPIRLGLIPVALVTLACAALFVASPFPEDYLEGVAVDAVRRLVSGARLYCDVREVPCVMLPHPPLYVGIVAALSRFLGPSMELGRAVSGGFFAGALVLLRALARQRVDARAAILAPALYLSFVESGYYSVLMRPEPMAVCLELLALWIAVARPTARGAAASGVVLVAAVFTKPSVLAGLLAVVLVVALRDRRQLAALLATCALSVAVGMGAGQALSGGFFIANHVLMHARRAYSLAAFLNIAWYGALAWLPILLAALALAVRAVKRGERDFAVIFFFTSAVWCPFAASIEGAGTYYYLELYAAVGLLLATRANDVAAAAATARDLWFGRAVRVAIWGNLTVALFVNALIAWQHYAAHLALWRDAPALLRDLRGAPGFILSEEPIVSAAAGLPLITEPYVNRLLVERSGLDERPLLAMLEDGRVSRVVLVGAPIERTTSIQRERLSKAILDEVSAHFRLRWSDGTWFVYEHVPAPS